MERVCESLIRISGIIHLIGHLSMMQMFSFNFRVLIRIQELISIRNQSRDSFILLKMNTLHYGKSSWESIRISIIILLIGHISMMQMFSFNFGFWFRIQELISIRKQYRGSFILIKLNTYTHGKSMWESIWISGKVN